MSSKEVDDFIKSSAAVMQAQISLNLLQAQKEREEELYRTTAPIHGLNYGGIAYCESMGLSKVFASYAENASGETIESIGFNRNSGFVYIALENGVSLCSMLGQSVEYLVTNPQDGEEVFLDSYDAAVQYEWVD